MDPNEEERKQTLWEYLTSKTPSSPRNLKIRPLMIMLLALGIGLIFIGLVLTIVGNLPGYSGGAVLKIVGPLILGVGALVLIAVIIDTCVRSEQASKTRELEKAFSDLTSSRSTVADGPGVISHDQNGWKQSGQTDVKVPITAAHASGGSQNYRQPYRNGVPTPTHSATSSQGQFAQPQPGYPTGYQDKNRVQGQVQQGQSHHPLKQYPHMQQPQGRQPQSQHILGINEQHPEYLGQDHQSKQKQPVSSSADDGGYLQPRDVSRESRLQQHPSNRNWSVPGHGPSQNQGANSGNVRSKDSATGKSVPDIKKVGERKQEVSDSKSGAPLLQIPKMRWGHKKKGTEEEHEKRKSGDGKSHVGAHGSPQQSRRDQKKIIDGNSGHTWGKSHGRSNEGFDGPKESTPKDPEDRTGGTVALNEAFEGETPKLKRAREHSKADGKQEDVRKTHERDRNRGPHDSSLDSQASRSRPPDPGRSRDSNRHRDSRRGRGSSRHKSDKDTSKGSRDSSVGHNKSRDSSLGRNKSLDDFNSINYLTGAPIDKDSRRKHRDGTSSEDDTGRRRAKRSQSGGRNHRSRPDDEDRNRNYKQRSRSSDRKQLHDRDDRDIDNDRRNKHPDLNSTSTSGDAPSKDHRRHHSRDKGRVRDHRGYTNSNFKDDSPENDSLEDRDRHRHRHPHQEPRQMDRAASTDTTKTDLVPFKPQNRQPSSQSLNVVSPTFTININAQAGSNVQIGMGGDKLLAPPQIQSIKETPVEPDTVV